MINFENIDMKFGDFHALKDINIEINSHETTVILGPSGAGKSTMLRCINLLEIPKEGKLTVSGITVDFSKKLEEEDIINLRKKTAMVFQSYNLFPHMNVLENVMEGLVTVQGKSKAEASAIATSYLEQVDLFDKKDAWPAQLSGGQKQRVAIARALAMEPDFVLLDEPTAALDPELELSVLKVLRPLAKSGQSLVLVTHNLDFARLVADRILFLLDGEIYYDGTSRGFFNHSDDERIQSFISSMKVDIEALNKFEQQHPIL